MASLNKVILIGNVGQDPEVRYLNGSSPSGSSSKVANLRLATTERYKDRNGEIREITEWHTVVAWRNLADIVEKFVKKGSQIYVEGKIRSRQWVDQNDNKRNTVEIQADNLFLLGRRQDSGEENGYGSPYQGYSPRAQSHPAPQPTRHSSQENTINGGNSINNASSLSEEIDDLPF